MVDIGDGVACVEFHSALQPRMNPIDEDIIEVMHKGIEIGERDSAVVALDSYLRDFPDGIWAAEARAELTRLANEFDSP